MPPNEDGHVGADGIIEPAGHERHRPSGETGREQEFPNLPEGLGMSDVLISKIRRLGCWHDSRWDRH
jgi:hypothetical protein